MKTNAFPSRGGTRLSVAVLAMLCTGGCASLSIPPLPSLPASLPLSMARKEPAVVPQALAVVWTGTVLQAPGATPTRGFGGLVTFYGADRNTPIRVDGHLTVYAYKDTAGASEKVAADVKYVFPAEQLAGHYGESKLGHTYSIWIPWDSAGGPRQELTLTACFQPVDGEMVLGTPARVVLQGPPKNGKPTAESKVAEQGRFRADARHGGVRAAGLSASRPAAAKQPPRQMTTATMPLPSSVER